MVTACDKVALKQPISLEKHHAVSSSTEGEEKTVIYREVVLMVDDNHGSWCSDEGGWIWLASLMEAAARCGRWRGRGRRHLAKSLEVSVDEARKWVRQRSRC